MNTSISRQKQKNRFYSIVFTIVLVSVLLLITFYKYHFPSSQSHINIVQDQVEQTSVAKLTGQDGLSLDRTDTKKQLLKHIEDNPISSSEADSIELDMRKLVAWVNTDDYAQARHYLIKKASMAVDQRDNLILGDVMQLLGRVSATEGDLASTEVYLFEALDIFEQTQNYQQIANTQLLIGQMYAKRRGIAKRAGSGL